MTQSCVRPCVLQCARRTPSRWNPAFSMARIDAMFSDAASAYIRRRPSSSVAHFAAIRSAREATPRPRASGNTETARPATSSSSPNWTFSRPKARSLAASATTNGAPRPVRHCSSARDTSSRGLRPVSGSSSSHHLVSGSLDASAIAGASRSSRSRSTITPSLSGSGGTRGAFGTERDAREAPQAQPELGPRSCRVGQRSGSEAPDARCRRLCPTCFPSTRGHRALRPFSMGRVGIEPTTLGLRVPCSTS